MTHQRPPSAGGQPPRPAAPKPKPAGEAALPRAERSILTVLAQYGTRTVTQVAVITGYSANGGGFRNALGALRSKGLIEGRDPLTITEGGHVAIAGDWQPLPAGRDLLEYWVGRLPKAEGLVLRYLYDVAPRGRTPEQVAEATAYVATGASGGASLGPLTTHAALTVAHGATGAVVGTTNTQTLSGKTLTAPTIADLSNAQHTHENGAGGGASLGPLTTHAALTAAHGATGAVVGTTNTQTISGKTLTFPTITSPTIQDAFMAAINAEDHHAHEPLPGAVQSPPADENAPRDVIDASSHRREQGRR